MKNNNPLSPHIQVYNWHISSLVSICHRITGIINIVGITIICFWVIYLLSGESSYQILNTFLNSIYGKFVILGLTWSFSFQILSEIRHLIMDYGLGFDLKIANITGSLVILGSIIFTVLIFILGRNLI
jgi:succinate dehydrogenase / fumarate reductase cytochrome b subunit